ncbi:hypothetical protein NKG05_01560 [Oerskovia sp. M15]
MVTDSAAAPSSRRRLLRRRPAGRPSPAVSRHRASRGPRVLG